MDFVGPDREDHPNLIAAAVPFIGATGPLGKDVNVLLPTLGRP
jgi:hypothetical protein